ncbi:hypothetical protein C1D09_003595 [Mesorhizobium intechi]|uniref:DUF6064 family protein n=1 Tax=Mesorhizobium intechi TaxID=537601 RepID=UPI000CB9D3C4|nr:DUF6064 family protein [Mesorhizobium intechi]TSE13480.1 hypothetical protein C1D09_003595 [Mesorhizobium intechi]
MNLPFGVEQFFAVFAAYNSAIWPFQIVAYVLGAFAVGAVLSGRSPACERIVFAVLSLLWAWNGVAYHLLFFSPVNPVAKVFAGLFIAQAALFAMYAVIAPPELRFELRSGWHSIAGLALILYSALVYEILGVMAGHGLMNGPLFGVAPCPSTIFTIGLLLLLRGRSVLPLSVIPVIWVLIGTGAALMLQVREDFGLAIAGLVLGVSLASDWLRRPQS